MAGHGGDLRELGEHDPRPREEPEHSRLGGQHWSGYSALSGAEPTLSLRPRPSESGSCGSGALGAPKSSRRVLGTPQSGVFK